MTVSLIISTYNRPDALRLCLDSILRQTTLPDEVIIGDDGSADDTRQVIEDFRKKCPVPLKHIWHEDDGFRLAMMRNKSVAAASGDYIVQIDGDIVLERHFIADHKAAATEGYFVKGSRVRLTDEFSRRACAEGVFKTPCIFSSGILKDREKSIRMPLIGHILSRRYKVDSTTGIGCNMAFWRSDFIAVNGYDEQFKGWGVEDNDLCIRLAKSGIHNFKLFRTGLCYHLYHREAGGTSERNLELLRQSKESDVIRCADGVDKYHN